MTLIGSIGGSLVRRIVRINRSLCKFIGKRASRYGSSGSYHDELISRIETGLLSGARSVLEVGGIDRPLLTKSGDFRYTGLDLESVERCAQVYDTFSVGSIVRARRHGDLDDTSRACPR